MKYYVLSFILLISFTSTAQKSRLDFVRENIEFLASDELQGRKTGTIYSEMALSFIARQVKASCGKKLKKSKFEILFGGKDVINATNGYVFLNNKKDSTILISAHYDHIGMGGNLSKTPGKIEVHNGADDNASGVALVIDLMKRLQNEKKPKYNYLFVFFDAHEIGLHGSDIFLVDPIDSKQFKSLAMHINFDMVGRLSVDQPVLKITNSSDLDDFIEKTITLPVSKGPIEKLTELDTNKSFEKGIPCMNVSTGIHADYHKPTDDSAYINFEGIITISDEILQLILSL